MRSSNIELLRIVAMLMIVVFHLVSSCIQTQITDADSIARMGNGVFNHPLIYKKLYILYTIKPFGKIGDAIFILISGYFMVKKGSKVDMAKTTKKLLLQLGFAALALVGISTVLYRFVWNGTVYVNMRTYTQFNSGSWFVGYYFLIILFGFLFLNKFLNSIDQKKYVTFLVVVLALSQFYWIGDMAEDLATGLRVLVCGVFLYSFGGYIDRYHPLEKLRTWFLFFIIALTYVIIYVSNYNNMVQKIEDYVRGGSKGTFYQSFLGFSDYSIVVIIIGIAMFELFRRLQIPNSRIINFVASSTLLIYLLHQNSTVYNIWNMKDWATLLAKHPYEFMLELALWTLATFAIGVLCYVAYLGIMALVRKSKVLALKKSD